MSQANRQIRNPTPPTVTDLMPQTCKLTLLRRSQQPVPILGHQCPHKHHPCCLPHPPPPNPCPTPTSPSPDFTLLNKKQLNVVYERQRPIISYIVEQYRRDELRILKKLIEMKESEENREAYSFIRKGDGQRREDLPRGSIGDGVRHRQCCEGLRKNINIHRHKCHRRKQQTCKAYQTPPMKMLSPAVFRPETLIKQNKFISYVEQRIKESIATKSEMQQVVDILHGRLNFLLHSDNSVLKKHPGLLYKFRDYEDAVRSIGQMENKFVKEVEEKKNQDRAAERGRRGEARESGEQVTRKERNLGKAGIVSEQTGSLESSQQSKSRPMTSSAKINTSKSIRVSTTNDHHRKRFSRITKIDSMKFNCQGQLQNTFSVPLTPTPITSLAYTPEAPKFMQIKTISMIEQLQQIEQVVELQKKTLRPKFKDDKMGSFGELRDKSSKKTIGSRKEIKRRTSMEEEVDKDNGRPRGNYYSRKKMVEFTFPGTAEDGKPRESKEGREKELRDKNQRQAKQNKDPNNLPGDTSGTKPELQSGMNFAELSKLKKRQKRVVKLEKNSLQSDAIQQSVDQQQKSQKTEYQVTSSAGWFGGESMDLTSALKNLNLRKRRKKEPTLIKSTQPIVSTEKTEQPAKEKQTVTYLKINPYNSFIFNKQILSKQCLKLQQLLSSDSQSIKELASKMRRCSKRTDQQKSKQDESSSPSNPTMTQIHFFKSSLSILGQIRKGLQCSTKAQLLQFLQHFLKCTLIRQHSDKQLTVSKGNFSIDKKQFQPMGAKEKKVSKEFEDSLLDFSRMWPRVYDQAVMKQSAAGQMGVMELCKRFF